MKKYKVKTKTLEEIKIKTLRELALRIGVKLDVLQTVGSNISNHYHKTPVIIKSKKRTFFIPDKKLKGIQKAIEKELLNRFDYPSNFHGAIKGRSTKTNANPHTNKQIVAKFDIKDFFPNVSNKRIYKMFVSQGCSPDVSRVLTSLTTAEGHMPQGFVTSPKLSPLVLLPINERLLKLLKKYGLEHTIWIDDITISGSFPIKKIESSVCKIFSDNGFKLKKPVYQYNNIRQEVTGAVVNAGVFAPKNIVKEVENIKFLIEKKGIEKYIDKYHDASYTKNDLKNYIFGKISYLMSLNKDKYNDLKIWFKDAFK